MERQPFCSWCMDIACCKPALESTSRRAGAHPDRYDSPDHTLSTFLGAMFGSGRAILTLRESYREDLRAVKQVTDFRYVRFHAILHDEVGVYNEDGPGNPVYNFHT